MSREHHHPRVSVIIPLCNMGLYVREALASVLGQTYPDWEAWVVDDGSGDNGPEIVRNLASAHPSRIHYMEHPGHANRGVSASRNLAIESSHSELVAFLDADDVWLPDKLESQVRVFDSNPDVGLVYSSALPIGEDGSAWSSAEDETAPVKIVSTENGEPRIGYGPSDKPVSLFEELVRHCCLVNSSVIVRRDVLDRAGRFDESMPYCEDWLLYTCVAYYCKSYFINRPLIKYRISSQNFTSSLIGNELGRLRGSATFYRKLPSKLNVRDANLKRLIRENCESLYGRALTEAEVAWAAGNRRVSLALARFAFGAFPSLLFSRRSARFVKTLVCGTRN